jgi:hypothetical protein
VFSRLLAAIIPLESTGGFNLRIFWMGEYGTVFI